MKTYVQTVTERRSFDVLYYIEANSSQEADEKAQNGETVKEVELKEHGVTDRTPYGEMREASQEEVKKLQKKDANPIITVVEIRDGVVYSSNLFYDVKEAEKDFEAKVRHWAVKPTAREISTWLEDGYFEFAHGSVCITWPETPTQRKAEAERPEKEKRR